MITHYIDTAANPAWIREQLEMETEGELTPIQAEPHEVVMDENTPALLRRQAA